MGDGVALGVAAGFVVVFAAGAVDTFAFAAGAFGVGVGLAVFVLTGTGTSMTPSGGINWLGLFGSIV